MRQRTGSMLWNRNLPGSSTSVVWDDNGQASMPLTSGGQYTWSLEERSAARRCTATVATDFSVQ